MLAELISPGSDRGKVDFQLNVTVFKFDAFHCRARAMTRSTIGLEGIVSQTLTCKRDRQFSRKCKSHSLNGGLCFVCEKSARTIQVDHDVCRFAGMSSLSYVFGTQPWTSVDFRHIKWSPSTLPRICFSSSNALVSRSHTPQVFNRTMTEGLVLEQLVRLLDLGSSLNSLDLPPERLRPVSVADSHIGTGAYHAISRHFTSKRS